MVRKLLAVELSLILLVACNRVPAGVGQSQAVVAEFQVVHSVPLGESSQLLARVRPIPIPQVTLEELLRRSPAWDAAARSAPAHTEKPPKKGDSIIVKRSLRGSAVEQADLPVEDE